MVHSHLETARRKGLKKIYASSQWKEAMLIRRKCSLKRSRRPRASRPFRTALFIQEYKRLACLKRRELQAPDSFSVLNNPDEFCKFIQDLKHELEEHGKIGVNLEKVSEQTPEALTLFISNLAAPRERLTSSVGSIPKDLLQRQTFLASGICAYLKLNRQVHQQAEAGNILRRKNYRVEPETAAVLKKFAMESLHGADRQHLDLYRILIELMANTHNHAKGSRQQAELWWASASRISQNRIGFTFVDNGIGIFASVGETMNTLRKVARSFGIQDNRDFLKHLLNGELQSSTGMKNRGKGIPRIYELVQKGKVENLTIVTNDVFAKVGADDYRRLSTPFDGTLWYWEVALPGQKLMEVTI